MPSQITIVALNQDWLQSEYFVYNQRDSSNGFGAFFDWGDLQRTPLVPTAGHLSARSCSGRLPRHRPAPPLWQVRLSLPQDLQNAAPVLQRQPRELGAPVLAAKYAVQPAVN